MATSKIKKARKSRAVEVTDEQEGRVNAMTGPSTDPATNLLIADLVIRGITRITRKTMHKGILRKSYSPQKAEQLSEARSIVSTLALYGMSRIATKSVPGALLVSGGLLAKTLYDRGKSKRLVKEPGEPGPADALVVTDPDPAEEKQP